MRRSVAPRWGPPAALGPRRGCGPELSGSDVTLSLHRGVWLVVCQAALLAMDQGRGLLYKWQKQQGTPGEPPLPPYLQTAQQRMQAACRVAEAAFWDRLHDFVGLKLCPEVWLGHISATHPFLCAVMSEGALDLRVRRTAPPA